MPGLTLYTSNRLEILAEELAGVLRRPGDPLQSDIVVVQSRGMERWLTLTIARLNGILANCQFPFPNAFIEDVFGRLFAYDKERSPFEDGALTFRILRLLPDLLETDVAFDDLRTYLESDWHGVKGFQLAAEIADLLDQYLIFRPRMLLDWEKQEPSGPIGPFPWQPALWRQLARDSQVTHRAALWQALIEGLKSEALAQASLPQRISLFGVSYLPPYYLQLLEALAVTMTVDIYQLNPCQEYWSDIASDREIARIKRGMPASQADVDLDALHLETGNRLLASMGAHGREFHTLIAELDCPVTERFKNLVPDTRLKAVQHDLLHLTNRDGGTACGGQPCSGGTPDLSIQIHACHGPMREIEVLSDQLLALLDAHPDIEPRDILVMTPDIERYAPYIQAVFGAAADDRLHLPFSIADRSLASASPLVAVFNRLLALRTSRFTHSEILALLEFGPLRARFGFSETDLVTAAEMIERVRIRWGIDGGDKARWHLPAAHPNTWRHGLDRLVLGYALHPEPDRLCGQLLPADRVEGNQAAVIGRLSDLIETLARFSRTLDTPRPPAQWHHHLVQALSAFFVRDERYEYDLQVLERLLGDFRRGCTLASFDTPVDLDVVRAYLDRSLPRERYRGGFIAGGITFAALLPMRSIPAEIICLVGLDHDAFPRLDRPRSFDLMALEPRLGDRSRRSDDRYLFLEALISARRCLYISYAGFDLHDNSVRPPSVLISELMDYLQEGYGLDEDELVVKHRLQPFSPDYFRGKDERLFSYNRDHAQAAGNLTAAGRIRPDAEPFLPQALALWSEEFLTLTPDDLLDALVHPCRFLLERRLDIQLQSVDQTPVDREAFELSALEQFQEGQWLVSRHLEGMPRAEAAAVQQARATLPPGEAGQALARQLADEVETFTARIRPFVQQPVLPPRTYRIELDGFRIDGRLEIIHPEGPVVYRFSRANGRTLMGAWIQHLVYCHLASDEPKDVATILICRDEVRRFHYVADSRVRLAALLDIYFQAAHVPLPIFPNATPAFARQRFERSKPAATALKAAQRAWQGNFKVPGDSEDPYIALGFRGRDPWTPDFEILAQELFAPLFANSETIA